MASVVVDGIPKVTSALLDSDAAAARKRFDAAVPAVEREVFPTGGDPVAQGPVMAQAMPLRTLQARHPAPVTKTLTTSALPSG